jgi:hypothetical protein
LPIVSFFPVELDQETICDPVCGFLWQVAIDISVGPNTVVIAGFVLSKASRHVVAPLTLKAFQRSGTIPIIIAIGLTGPQRKGSLAVIAHALQGSRIGKLGRVQPFQSSRDGWTCGRRSYKVKRVSHAIGLRPGIGAVEGWREGILRCCRGPESGGFGSDDERWFKGRLVSWLRSDLWCRAWVINLGVVVVVVVVVIVAAAVLYGIGIVLEIPGDIRPKVGVFIGGRFLCTGALLRRGTQNLGRLLHIGGARASGGTESRSIHGSETRLRNKGRRGSACAAGAASRIHNADIQAYELIAIGSELTSRNNFIGASYETNETGLTLQYSTMYSTASNKKE